jgi:hypothetical protein
MRWPVISDKKPMADVLFSDFAKAEIAPRASITASVLPVYIDRLPTKRPNSSIELNKTNRNKKAK